LYIVVDGLIGNGGVMMTRDDVYECNVRGRMGCGYNLMINTLTISLLVCCTVQVCGVMAFEQHVD
jgi:hypothetical protein